MTEEELKIKKDLYQRFIKGVLDVYEIFKEFFDEENVDLQNMCSEEFFIEDSNAAGYLRSSVERPFIIVHFPEVRITNEHDRYVDVKDLWAKVYVNHDGSGGNFALNRSHYWASHLRGDYMHSHCSGIPFSDFTQFKSPCLGDGPIRNTIGSLSSEFDENLWRLYCRELEVYVRTESLSGGPYRRLENIHNNRLYMIDSNISRIPNNTNEALVRFPLLTEFLTHVIMSRKIKYCFSNGNYSLAMSSIDYYVTISNLFIEWYNDMYNNRMVTKSFNTLLADDIVNYRIIKDGMIYKPATYANNLESLRPKVLDFKGREIHLEVEPDGSGEDRNMIVMLNKLIADAIIGMFLFILNVKYGREESEEAVATGETVKYVF